MKEIDKLREENKDLNKAIIILFDASDNWYQFVSEKDASLVYKAVDKAKEKQ